MNQLERVTPYVGVWIETILLSLLESIIESLLMWECGLKQLKKYY